MLGIEPVEPPVLVKNQEESGNDEDQAAPPVEVVSGAGLRADACVPHF